MPDKEGFSFNLLDHLAKKGKRDVIPLEVYDSVLEKIITALKTSLISKLNVFEVTDLVVFGSWARRDLITGPTFRNTDLDLLSYRGNCREEMSVKDNYEFQKIVRYFIGRQKISNMGIHFKEISVCDGVAFCGDLQHIFDGRETFTADGYLIISKT